MDDSRRSVRIEVGTDAPRSEVAPEVAEVAWVSSPGRTKTVALVVGAFVVLALGSLALSLRPDAGETAAGDQRQASTTTTPSNTTTTPQAASGDEASPEEATVTETTGVALADSITRINNGGGIIDIVPAQLGYLAIGWHPTRSGPHLFRSIDGQDWQPLVATFESEVAERNVEFSHLIATEEGFAMLGTSFSQTLGSGGASSSQRYVSEDGINWRLDSTFEPVLPDDVDSWPFIHRSDFVIASVYRHGHNELLADLLGRHVADPEQLPEDICWAWTVGIGTLALDACGIEQVEITAEQFNEPDLASSIMACATILGEFGGQESLFVRHSVGADTATSESLSTGNFASFWIAPALLDDGSMAMIDLSAFLAEEFSVCDGLVELPFEANAPALIHRRLDGTSNRFDLPDGTFQPILRGGPPEFGVTSHRGEVILLLGGKNHALDVETGEWRSIDAELGGVASFFSFGGLVAVDGHPDTVVWVDGATLGLTNLATGDWVEINVDVSRTSYGSIVFADERYVFVDYEGVLRRIDISQVDLDL